MSNTRIDIDPEGDVLIILPLKKIFSETENSETPQEKHYLCSKKHLTLASRRAAKIFASQFKEASQEEDGLHHWKFDGTFNDQAFEIILKIIHGKTRHIPRTTNLDLLANIATIVDDLECHEAVAFFTINWLFGYPSGATEIRGKALAQLILASFVFEHAVLFETYTKMAIRYNDGALSTFELPIRGDISSK
ncbi:hypothetical protein FBEOM_13721 [Fusarium beomiforme]|uniref:BTB domain-containing protein n=1 Tax=Fusarium beomiforme TaxID=44412 RepID=A0A9P5DN47_9HYPO|nr:hypothetical protein FBEOM_13721 [Fusarium beomiforme]